MTGVHHSVMPKTPQLLPALLAALTVGWLPATLHAEDSYYTGEPVYELRPKPESHKAIHAHPKI